MFTRAEGDTPLTILTAVEHIFPAAAKEAMNAPVFGSKTLDCWSSILPSRIVNEELGDYLEDMSRRAAAGQSRLRIGLRCFTAMFWTGVNAIGYLREQLGSKKGA